MTLRQRIAKTSQETHYLADRTLLIVAVGIAISCLGSKIFSQATPVYPEV